MVKQSLQDQLLKAGLVDKKRADQVLKQQKKAQRKKGKSKKNAPIEDESKQAAEQAAKNKLEADRALNAEQQRLKEQKEADHRIDQIIQTNALAITEADQRYHFVDDAKVQQLYVSADLIQQLANGQITIAKWKDKYHLVDASTAKRIEAVRPSLLIKPSQDKNDDVPDDYADYQIPDDLMW